VLVVKGMYAPTLLAGARLRCIPSSEWLWL